MTHHVRIARLATRVAQARRPKRLGASTRLAMQQPAAEPEPELAGDLPKVTLASGLQQAQEPALSLPVSEEATRWLTQGEMPTDLVPLLGDPALPSSKPPTTAEQRPVQRAPLMSEPEPGSNAGHVVASIIEGAPPPVSEHPAQALGEGAPLMRLARAPVAKALAQASGGDLSDDGMGTSTVTFQPAPSPAAPGASHPAAPPSRPPSAGLASATPIASSLREQLGDVDVDELYEGFLNRLRRELLHDRERLGDLLGPLQ